MPTTTNFGWTTPADTDLVKDGALAIRTLGNGIDTSMVDLKGGTTGQVLSKASNTDMDFTWVTQDDADAIQNAIVDAKGDIITATAADTPARLAVGTNGHVLTADSTTATGLKWAAAAGGGKVLQVITDTDSTEMSSSSSTYTDTNLSVTITPSSTSSKIMVFVYDTCQRNTTAQAGVNYRLVRGSTTIVQLQNIMYSDASEYHQGMISIAYLDSPATTSATTYKTTFANNGQGTAQVHMQNNITAITVMEIGA